MGKNINMRIFNFGSLVLLILISINSVNAIGYRDDPLEPGTTLKLSELFEKTEIHADGAIGNFFIDGVAGSDKVHDGIIDYRFEAHTPIYNLRAHKGSIVTRVEGFGLLNGEPGDNINGFFDDPLIDIPELFYQDDFEVGGSDVKLVFGKFANRRFFDKDEVAPDPFDIGERPYFSITANTNNLLNSINQFRDNDQFNSIQATGSYGFMLSAKDRDGDTFWDRWGYKQAFAVAEVDNFANNFYGISEINKNWGYRLPGQFNLGFLYANEDVFRNGSDQNSYLLYSSLVQRVTSKFIPYFRYGLLNTSSFGTDVTISNISAGALYQLTQKDILASHIIWSNVDAGGDAANPIINVNYWTHKFSQHFSSVLFAVWKYNQPSFAAFDGEDNNWFMGLSLNAAL